MFIAYKYIVILEFTLHDFPTFALFSHTIVKMSEGTFCRVEVQLYGLAWLIKNRQMKGPKLLQSLDRLKDTIEIRTETEQKLSLSLSLSLWYSSNIREYLAEGERLPFTQYY